jgi:Kef-type K+ transport system membrane component KefB
MASDNSLITASMEFNPTINSNAVFLLALGSILLLGLLASFIGHRTFLPRVTLLLIVGIAFGNEGLGIIPPVISDKFGIIAEMALLMVGFLLGGKLTRDSLDGVLHHSLYISLCAAVITALVVGLGLLIFGVRVEVAIILGCIASATAPAAILDIVNESESMGRFKNLLLSIVALDDAWALMLFGVGVAVAFPLYHGSMDNSSIMFSVQHIGGAVLLGLMIGIPSAYLTGRLKSGQPSLSEALGIVFICGGLALWFDVSYLIATMVLGATIANLARHHDYPFHAIEGIEEQFMMLFFVLAGASLEIEVAIEIGMLGILFIGLRSIGKVLGARIGGTLAHTDPTTNKWMGVALLPQAGVAIGMALVAGNYFPDHAQLLLSVVISSTVFFEIIGPIFTRMAIRQAEKG